MQLTRSNALVVMLVVLTGVISACRDHAVPEQVEYSIPLGPVELLSRALQAGDFDAALQVTTLTRAQLESLPAPVDPEVGRQYTVRSSSEDFPYRSGIYTIVYFDASNYMGQTTFYVARVQGIQKVVAVQSAYLTVPAEPP